MSDDTSAALTKPLNPYGRISDIAKRLGVAPYTYEPDVVAVVMNGNDGHQYNVFDVVVAVLDRIDKATEG